MATDDGLIAGCLVATVDRNRCDIDLLDDSKGYQIKYIGSRNGNSNHIVITNLSNDKYLGEMRYRRLNRPPSCFIVLGKLERIALSVIAIEFEFYGSKVYTNASGGNEMAAQAGRPQAGKVFLRVTLNPSFFEFDDDTPEAVYSATNELIEYISKLDDVPEETLKLCRREYGLQKAQNENLYETTLKEYESELDATWASQQFKPANPNQTLRDLAFQAMLPTDWKLERQQPDGLKCQMYHYQRRALQWMLYRETIGGVLGEGFQHKLPVSADSSSVKSRLPTISELWQKVLLPSGLVVYHNEWAGLVSLHPDVDCIPAPQVAGGMLCDEMGLGKTVCIISLVLANKPPKDRTPSTSSGDGDGKHRPLGGTVVVCPPALLDQWENEISRHSDDTLRVFVYRGLRANLPVDAEAHLAANGGGGDNNNDSLTDQGKRKNTDPFGLGSTTAGSGSRGRASKKMKGGTKVTSQMQREMEYFNKLMAGELPPTEDLTLRASEIASIMSSVDIVLTSFDILQQEVHYQAESERLKSLRHAKRYAVPDCPLLQVDWWRMVADEAQMVAPFGATGEMLSRLNAAARWCVTGTPISSRRELEDINDLLIVVGHASLGSPHTWKLLMGPLKEYYVENRELAKTLLLVDDDLKKTQLKDEEDEDNKGGGKATSKNGRKKSGASNNNKPNNTRYSTRTGNNTNVASSSNAITANNNQPAATTTANVDREAQHAWLLLLQTLRLMFWRNTKDVVHEEYHLPPRSLHRVHLRLQPGEKEFYEQLVDQARKDRADLLKAEAGEEIEVVVRGSAKRGANARSAAASRATRKRKLSLTQVREAAVDSLTELRLSCIHPQLTTTWQQRHSSELQIGAGGGVLSMDEVLNQMVNKMQADLQDMERTLAAHLNTLAMVLLGTVQDSSSLVGSPTSPDPSSPTANGAGGSGLYIPSSAAAAGGSNKRRKKSANPTPEAIEDAISLLEQSFRVYEKGIDGLDRTMEDFKELPEPVSGATASWRAWKIIHINCLSSLVNAYRLAKRPAAVIQDFEKRLSKQQNDLREQGTLDVKESEKKVETLRDRIQKVRTSIVQRHDEAVKDGFPGNWGLTTDAESWLEALDTSYNQAVGEEANELAQRAQQSKANDYVAVMGTAVKKLLEAEEKRFSSELNTLENWTTAMKVEQGVEELEGALHTIARGNDPTYSDLRWMMGCLVHLLTPFRRDTLRNKYERVFPMPKPVAIDDTAAAAGTGGGGELMQVDTEGGVEKDHAGPSSKATTTTNNNDQTPTMMDEDRALQLQLAAEEEQGAIHRGTIQKQYATVEYLKEERLETEDASLRRAAQKGAEFIPCDTFKGMLTGYAFTLQLGANPRQLGYFKDASFERQAPLREVVHHCGTVLLRTLRDYHTKLLRQCNPSDIRAFKNAGVDATNAKFHSVQQQVQLVRLLKDLHVAECNLTLHNGLLEDVDMEVEDAKRFAPSNLRSVDVLKRQIDGIKNDARSLKGKKGYYHTQLVEATTAAVAPPQKQLLPDTNTTAADTAKEEEAAQVVIAIDVEDANGGENTNIASTSKPAATNDSTAFNQLLMGPQGLDAQRSVYECPVCLQAISGDLQLFEACGHVFCVDCTKILVQQGQCPVCRVKITHRGVVRAMATSRKIGLGLDSEYDPEAAADDALRKVDIQAKWSIKVEALVRRIKQIVERSSDEKILVFSQFPAALKLVALALKTNSIRFAQLLTGSGGRNRGAIMGKPRGRTPKKQQQQQQQQTDGGDMNNNGAEASGSQQPPTSPAAAVPQPKEKKLPTSVIEEFLKDDDIRVFLLSHKAGAQGLTLVQANHVFLLEPALDPSIEQQAVARVHRIGQQRPVHVVRLLVDSTIEEEVLRIQESRQVLFTEGHMGIREDENEEDAELATTVAEAVTKQEMLGEEDAMALLDAVTGI